VLSGAIAALAVVSGLSLSPPVTAVRRAGFPGRNGLIAFAHDEGGAPVVDVVKGDSSLPKKLVRSGADAPAPSWTPDGSKIAYVRVKGGSGEI
jgi:hypothetical protein